MVLNVFNQFLPALTIFVLITAFKDVSLNQMISRPWYASF